MLEALYNRKLHKGREVVGNAFGILKATWQKLLGKLELNVVYMRDVITACAILHNISRKQTNEDLEALGAIVDNGLSENDNDNVYSDVEVYDICDYKVPQSRTTNNEDSLRRSLASYMGSRRGVRP